LYIKDAINDDTYLGLYIKDNTYLRWYY